ncbi:MAG: T9SS type A sorting domain-containing protein, partial [Flavobacteriales bacterium]
AESSPVTITNSMINEYGGNLMTVFPFANALQLDSGKVYLATVGSEQGSGSFVCALSGNSPAGSSFVRAAGSEDIWFGLSRTPMVRLNAEAPVVSVNESISNSFLVYPNPAMEKVHITLSNATSANAHYIITNLSSQVVASGNMVMENFAIDCEKFPAGLYSIIIMDNEKVWANKFIVQH